MSDHTPKEDVIRDAPAVPAGTGVDRTAIRQRLALTPAERARVAGQEGRKLDEFRRRLRR